MNSMIDEDNELPVYTPAGVERFSPNSGKRYYTPVVEQSLKPVEGTIFKHTDDAYSLYTKYARAAGFSVRKSTQIVTHGVLTIKYFVCSKEGFRNVVLGHALDNDGKRKVVRKKPSKRTGCLAGIRLRLLKDNTFELYEFVEEHNHGLVHQDDIHLLTAYRGLSYTQKKFIRGLSNINLGPVKAFNIMKELYGGYDKVGATKSDVKNYKNEVNLAIGDNDAAMFVSRLLSKKEFLPNFFCEYDTKSDGTLKCVFWADEDHKRNFFSFGDVVGFDATYRTNGVGMIFVPFTAIDNHNRNVTIAGALIDSETTETYKWLLTRFKLAFSYEPMVVVTDQDPAVMKVVDEVFTNSRHRLCMWHVMQKVTAKVGSNLCNRTDFKKKLGDIVWADNITPETFEAEWKKIMTEFELTDHEWLLRIFELRHIWIPSYYMDENMSGIMRTTSRSESENHYFGKFCNPKCTLVEFLSHFDTAMECQRYEHRKNDHETRYTSHEMLTDYILEEQAAQIYTQLIFVKDVQVEIDASIRKCMSDGSEMVNDFRIFRIKDYEQPCYSFFQVKFRKDDVTASCSCLRFEQYGLLCRHIFNVLRFSDVLEFPKQYILRRWTREAVPNGNNLPMVGVNGVAESDIQVDTVVREIMFSAEYVVNKLVTDMEKLCSFRDHMKEYMSTVDSTQKIVPEPTRKDRFAIYAGYDKTTTATVRRPVGIRFKGCGSGKRMKSQREKAIIQSGKRDRRCTGCHSTGHDIRNCDVVILKRKHAANAGTNAGTSEENYQHSIDVQEI
ncbi:hypothetical protein SSX86_003297 [Deinandra increscens subsp. villosa]|uniref:SWIM-type domain-containing protein n=1 Tax=Deinandra increscens subsp. villosa TaxID=3103831 RepID=A0AAP0DPX0_9ASTR